MRKVLSSDDRFFLLTAETRAPISLLKAGGHPPKPQPKEEEMSKSPAKKFDAYEMITTSIVAAIEEGLSKGWEMPWHRRGAGAALAPCYNAKSGHRYRGINVLLTSLAMNVNGWNAPGFVTFKQAKALGGCVRKGEKATKVVLWKKFDRKADAKEALDGEGRLRDGYIRAGDEFRKKSFFLKAYSVFNVEQCDDLPARFYADRAPEGKVDFSKLDDAQREAAAEELIAATGAKVSHGGDRAFYRPGTDSIRLPEFERFESPAAYYSTAFHELGHWTGHESRLDRTFGARFGDTAYAREELVAELCAAFLCSEFSLDGRTQHPEYIAEWLRVLKADSKAIVMAAQRAQKAADFVLSAREGDELSAPGQTGADVACAA